MKTIRLIDKLDLNEGNLVTTVNGGFEKVFIRQGDMDGACGPYCLFMALLINGVVRWDDVQDLWNVKGSTRLGKLVKGMRSHHTLFSEGTDSTDLQELLDKSFGYLIEINASESVGKKLIPFIVKNLNNNSPVIVGVRGKGLAHWLLAIGYENKDEVTKLFFLDSANSNNRSYWNAAIEVSGAYPGIYPYPWLDFKKEENEFVQLDEAIVISLR